MINRSMSEMSIQELVDRFAELSAQRGRAIELLQRTSHVNRLGAEMYAIGGELSGRPGNQRTALTQLFSRPDDYVRFNAAVATISVAKVEARAVIQSIADSKEYPLAGEAGIFLSMYDGEMSKLLSGKS